MSSGEDIDSGTAYADFVDRYTDGASAEAVEALEAIENVVDQGGVTVDEASDVGVEVMDILDGLAAGDRMATVDAALDLFDDQTGKEVEEAVNALESMRGEAQAALDEVLDFANVLSEGAAEVVDGMAKIELPREYFR